MTDRSWLQVQGATIVNGAGEEVALRGVGLGGWMNMEHFITGHPSTEGSFRRALAEVIGIDRAERFFDQLLTVFFDADDAQFVKDLGMNAVRLPINHRHLIPDAQPEPLTMSGFRHLDRVIDLCSEMGLYTIIDLHTVPGGQNQAWHSDNPTHRALFWEYRHFQDDVVKLWVSIADRYKDNPYVVGYNLLNEPGDPSERDIVDYYNRLANAIREVDSRHILFLDGNRFSHDFHMFDTLIPNAIYAAHHYPLPGWMDGGPYPGTSRGRHFDRSVVEQDFLEATEFMRRTGTPIWIGEFGPVYWGDPERDAGRYQLLQDQLDLYREHNASWSLWTYKDIGLQGLVTTRAESPWLQRVGHVVEKKRRLGSDTWGTTDAQIRHVMAPIEELFATEFPSWEPFPFGKQWLINRLVRHILIAEALVPEFGASFKGVDDDELSALINSFRFDQCEERSQLVSVLREALT